MKRKILAVLLSATMILSVAGCGIAVKQVMVHLIIHQMKS